MPRDHEGSQGYSNQIVENYTLTLWCLPCTMQLNILGASKVVLQEWAIIDTLFGTTTIK